MLIELLGTSPYRRQGQFHAIHQDAPMNGPTSFQYYPSDDFVPEISGSIPYLP